MIVDSRTFGAQLSWTSNPGKQGQGPNAVQAFIEELRWLNWKPDHWRRALEGAVLCLALVAVGPFAVAGNGAIPAWKMPLPGTSAFLGDDGGGSDMATLCNTAAHYREWLDYGHPPGCKKFPRGLRVVLEGVLYDQSKDTIPGTTTSLPLVKIRIPSQHFTGYVELLGTVHPNVPPGTIVHLKRDGNEVPRLAPSQDAALDSGPDLGDRVTAKVLRYDPATGDRDLYVTVIDGPHRGQTGWVFTLDANSDDGEPVDIFAQSALEVPRPPQVDRLARIYAIQKGIRAFKDIAVCKAGMMAMSNDRAFKVLQNAYSKGEYYDFPAGTELHIVEDNDPQSPFLIVGDDHGHQGCISRYALPGYVPR